MKYNVKNFIAAMALLVVIFSCNNKETNTQPANEGVESKDSSSVAYDTTFKVEAEAFADLQILRYQVPGFSRLSLQQKQLAYYLYEAALSGRDIYYDQRSKYGLTLRKTLETAYSTFQGDKTSDDWKKFEEYCGRFWFSNGNHHHYGNEKFIPGCPAEYFSTVIKGSDTTRLPKENGESVQAFLSRITPLVYDLRIEPKLVDLSPNIDNIKASSVNFYEGVTQKEVEAFYSKFSSTGNAPEWGHNSKTVKEGGQIVEKVWKAGGMYSPAIEKIIGWLQKAVTVAENDKQKKALQLLIEFYQTGDLKKFDEYSIAWIRDVNSVIDVVNGFIETYDDPISKKGSFESVVSMKDMEATRRIKAIADQAQWFEDNSPLMPEHKKKEVKGIIAKAITVIVQSGACAPPSAIGINLPNNEWIRKDSGSKSVSLSNIIYSYNVAGAKSGLTDEFALNDSVAQRMKKWGALASDLHTDMHECIGHASGQINPGVETTEKTLKN